MTLNLIPLTELTTHTVNLWRKQGLLLTCGDFNSGEFNTMTIGWGSLGVMWSRPFALVAVRPTRHTYKFSEQYDSFTISAFPEKYASALQLLGTKSGRDGDKIAEAGITPIASRKIAAPGFEEAELIIECKKNYWDDLRPDHFLDPAIEKSYPLKDYHRIYYGEILAVSGIDFYRIQ